MFTSEEANGGNVRLMNLGHTPAETLSKVVSDFQRVKDRVMFKKIHGNMQRLCAMKNICFNHIHLFKELYDVK